MTLWKLGCRWGSNTPLFYDFIKNNNIVIGWEDKKYNVGDWLLITDGFTVLAFAKVVEEPKSCLEYPQLEQDFLKLKIPYEKGLIFSRANWIVLKKADYFSYELRQGIVRVSNTEIKNKFNSLLLQYQKAMAIEKKIEILGKKKQIILQGPPGTGKTYTAKDIAYKMIFNQDISTEVEKRKEQIKQLESSEQFKLVQFHPSYSYEDFVRGITAKSQDGSIEYITENKVLAKFAEKASENFENNQKNEEVLSKELWFKEKLKEYCLTVNNEIDKTGKYILNNSKSFIRKVHNDRFNYYNEDYTPNAIGFEIRYKEFRDIFLEVPFNSDYETVDLTLHSQHRKLLIPLLQDFRKFIAQIPDNFEEGNKKIELVNYVLIIDEINRANLPSVLGELIYALEYRGEKVESMYEINGDSSLIIPPNLYIIGTMNTADRSVGHIDYAIRRRFAFVDILPDASVIVYPNAKALFEEISTLFNSRDTLASDFKAEQVQLGHSYFIVNDEAEFQLKAKYEIIPILEEYLKDGILLEKAEEKIKELKERFGN
jgi:MoxR-like ATPase